MDPWHVCYHKDSGQDFMELITWLGQVPVGLRSWVNEVVALPKNPHEGFRAKNAGGPIIIYGPTPKLSVLIHEAGHSLDFLGALTGQAPDDVPDDPMVSLSLEGSHHWFHSTSKP